MKRIAILAFCAGAAYGGPIVFRNAKIFDGTKLLPPASVLVNDGKIAAIGEKIVVPAGAEVIEGGDGTLLPGLIDSHVHAFGDSLRVAPIFGVTTVLDMFTDAKFAAQRREAQAAGRDPQLADLYSAGTLVTAPGGHGTEYGMKIPTISQPSEAQAFVDARIAEGSDYIKIVYHTGVTLPTISKATLAAVVAAAHKHKKMAVVHIGSQSDARDAIAAGADGLVHLFVDSAPEPDFGQFVAAHHAFVIPTLTVLESVSETPSGASLVDDANFKNALTFADINALKTGFPPSNKPHSYAFAEQTVRLLKAANVPILAGTDAPNPGTMHGASIHRELELLQKAGLTPMEALAAATSVPAERFHLKDRGRIAAGLRADLLLVKGDPTTYIKASRNIIGVWKAGAQIDRAKYLSEVDHQRAEAEKLKKAAPPAGVDKGLISDFEGDKPSSVFGSGWAPSTDAMAGGKSTVDLKLSPGGAQGSQGSLLITGNVDGGLPYAWAGATFSPGAAPMQPANLSSKKELTFWTKGDGKTYRTLVFTQSGGFMPAVQTFTAGPEWKRVTFSFAQFNGTDGHDIINITIAGGPAPGKFEFQIDDVRLQ